jgi:CubicO group peptidase (beta-lactamase class C family)
MTDNQIKSGWMEGFPPTDDKIISVERGNHNSWPQTKWTYSNIQQLAPTKPIWRGAGAARPLELKDAGFESSTVQSYDNRSLSWPESMEATDTDAIGVLHGGVLVHESYFDGADPHKPHLIMSCAKSFAGALAEMLIDEGMLANDALIPEYLPELKGTAWEDATLCQVLDMLIGMEFDEDYLNPKSEIWKYLRAGGMCRGRPGRVNPDT